MHELGLIPASPPFERTRLLACLHMSASSCSAKLHGCTVPTPPQNCCMLYVLCILHCIWLWQTAEVIAPRIRRRKPGGLLQHDRNMLQHRHEMSCELWTTSKAILYGVTLSKSCKRVYGVVRGGYRRGLATSSHKSLPSGMHRERDK